MLRSTYFRQRGRLEARKVGQIRPVPAGDKNILSLDVAMAQMASVRRRKAAEQLKGNPAFLNVGKERAGADTVVQVAVEELPDEIACFVCL